MGAVLEFINIGKPLSRCGLMHMSKGDGSALRVPWTCIKATANRSHHMVKRNKDLVTLGMRATVSSTEEESIYDLIL